MGHLFDPKKIFAGAKITESTAVLWQVAADVPYFEGHFPGAPVLPAVAILDGTLEFLEVTTGERWSLAEVEQAKFTRPIVPGTLVRVELEAQTGDGKRFDVRWLDAGGTAERFAELTVRVMAEGTKPTG